MRPWQKKHMFVSCWTWGTGIQNGTLGNSCHINHSPLKGCVELACPHRHSRGEQRRDSGRVVADTGDMTPPPLSTTLPTRFLTCLSLLTPPLLFLRSRQNGAVQHRPEKHKEFYHKLLLYALHWLTWFPAYLSSARLLIHPFRLMNYTTKMIAALGCYEACKRVKIPVLWQVAIKVLKRCNKVLDYPCQRSNNICELQ